MQIYFRGEVGDNQSWGISTIGNIKGFLDSGHVVTLDPMNIYGDIPDDIRRCINRPLPKYDAFIRQGLAKHMDELRHVGEGVLKISLSCWDSSLIDEESANVINEHADGVLALSSFTKKAFEDAGVTTPIHIGGQGFDSSIFYPSHDKKEGDFVFVTVAVAQGRKGTHALINAFEKALGNTKGVKLIIKSNSWGNLKDYGTKVDNIEKVYTEYSRKEMGELYRNCDCFVLPTEGDSFALPGIEAMACGLPLIITDFGGPCDYNTNDTGYRIKCDLKEAGYLPGHQATPNVEHLAELMHHVFTNRQEAYNKGREGSIIARGYWTWEADAQRNINFFKELLNKKRA